jgi:fumarate hydratase class I
VADMPVTVAVDATGASIHQTGTSQWRRPVISRLPVHAWRRDAIR